jgi:uncharacterized protein
MRTDPGQNPHQDWIVVLAKQPLAGHAKTRLARDIGQEEAQTLAEAFAQDTLELTSRQTNAQVLIAYTPAEGRGWFAREDPGAELFLQPDGPFGQRIHAATREAFRRGASRCVLIGVDTPQLLLATLTSAFEALRNADVCLGPAEDGGYYLIGLREDQEQLFVDIPWSSAEVRMVTLRRAAEMGLTVSELDLELDIDEGVDLESLAPILRDRPGIARRTRAAMTRITGWEP